MSEIAIQVHGLSKRYRIGGSQQSYRTLRDVVASTLSAPLRRSMKVLRGQTLAAAGASETIWALKDVSFEVRQGEVVGIIGRNGAGKSTLLKILSRITEPTGGYADIMGRVGSLLEVGTGFHQELTGRENIFLNGAILGMSRVEIKSKLDEIVAFAEVEKFIETPVKYYSSGMYMRLAFAVAAHLEPDILIVDEVLAVGDAAFQKKCLGKMGDVAKEGRTVLFVSHNMAAMQSLCKTGILLNDGRVDTIGPIGAVIYRYHDMRQEVGSLEGIKGLRVLRVRLNGDDETREITPESRVTVEMDFFTERRLPRCYINFVVEDAEGRTLIHSRTDMLGELPTFEPGLHHVEVEMPRLSLRAGVYSLWFRLFSNAGDAVEMADSERVMLEVTGPQVGGLVDVPCHWSWTEVQTTMTSGNPMLSRSAEI